MIRAALLVSVLLLASGAARAQTTEAGDTLRTDSVPAEPAPPARPSRWAAPFAVQSTGRPTPHRVQAEVVWVASSERPSRPTPVEAAEAPDTTAADSAPRPPRRTAQRDSTARPPRSAARDTAGGTPPRRTTRPDTTARRDTAATRRTPARRDSTAAPRTRPRTHIVAAGETLSGIARRYGATTAQLRALNPEATADGLETGAVLRLPPAPRAATGTPASATRPPQRPATAPARRRTHTVAAGETLYGLARRYGVTTDALRRANDLGPADGLRTGQTIVIPAPPTQEQR